MRTEGGEMNIYRSSYGSYPQLVGGTLLLDVTDARERCDLEVLNELLPTVAQLDTPPPSFV